MRPAARSLPLLVIVALVGLGFADAAHAENLAQMAQNFEQSFPGIRKLIAGSFALLGLGMVVGSLFAFVRHSEGKGELRTAIALFFVGIAFWQANDMVNTLTATMFGGQGNTDLFAYQPGGMSSGGALGGAMSAVLGFIQIVGYVAFGRGWILINRYAAGTLEDGLGRGLTHLAGGVLAINVKVTVMALVNTFAPNMAGTIQNFLG